MKRIPKKERRLEWEEEELRRRMLRRNDAADALGKAEAELILQERIVTLMRGEQLPLPPVEPLVGQPGNESLVTHPVSTQIFDGTTTTNAPNGGDWKVYLEQAEKERDHREEPLNIGIGKAVETLVEQEAAKRTAQTPPEDAAQAPADQSLPAAGDSVLGVMDAPVQEIVESGHTITMEEARRRAAARIACEAPRHYFSDAPNLPIGTPCFCGARQWGIDHAKEGAKP